MIETVTIQKLVHGGQAIGTLADGRKVFVWNALPGETVEVEITKKRRNYAEGIARTIQKPSTHRREPVEPDTFLATSPWQIMDFMTEIEAKQTIVQEIFAREHLPLPEFQLKVFGGIMSYRNKMEYGFWGDEDGVSFAHYVRGSRGKIKVQGSELTSDYVNDAGHALLDELNAHTVRASDLKSVIFRADRHGKVVAALFVKDESFKRLKKPANLAGLVVFYSNPKSPASIATRELYRDGDTTLTDVVLGVPLRYDVLSFFQGNVGIFERALEDIKDAIPSNLPIVDMYAGVGTIGLTLGASNNLVLVEIDSANIAMATENANGTGAQVVQASTEQALEYITTGITLIVDPPRSGLHKKVVQRMLEVKPETIIYLSCNPSTQARDVALLQEFYRIEKFEAYNFFPRTPHIESLAVLRRK